MNWRWPWVSRSSHEATIAIYEGIVAYERSRQADSNARFTEWYHGERERYNDLAARYHMLKLQGASEPAPAPPPREKPTPDIVKAAISRKCGRNKELRRQMEAQVEADRAAGVSDPEIALRIEQGVTDVVL